MTTEAIIPQATWEQVREEWNKAEQMGRQSVFQAAKVGQMLIELKESTPHGEFKEKCSSAALLEYRQAANLMTLARHITLLEERQPESQRAALAMIKEVKQEGAGMFRKQNPVWIMVAQKASESGIDITNPKVQSVVRKATTEILGVRNLRMEDAADPKVLAAVQTAISKAKKETLDETYASHRQEVAAMSETTQKKIERLSAREVQLLREMFQAEVRREFERTLPERIDELSAREKKVTAEIKKYQAMRNGIPAQMTTEDYKFLLGLLHPDRAPAGYEDKFNRAFQIIRKLDEYVRVANEQ